MKSAIRAGNAPRLGSRAAAAAFLALAAFGQSNAPAGQAPDQAPVFLPAFHQGLRWSFGQGDRATYRLKFPLGRGGNRVRVSFKGGDAPLQLFAASIALAGKGGVLASEPIPLTFEGTRGLSASPRQRFTSDAVDFAVSFGTEVYVSFDVLGPVAGSTINAFPDSYVWRGSYADEMNPPAGTPYFQASAVDTVDVEDAPGRALVALGDSITEGYVSGDVGQYQGRHDDYRNAWPTVAQGILQIPVANAAVSAEGIDDAIQALSTEVFTLEGITDCVALIGTNDLGSLTAENIVARIGDLLDQLRPFCRPWLGTLLPKEIAGGPFDYQTIVERRAQVNDWIRHRADVSGVIDFEAALAMPDDVNRFGPGLGEDGIHPSIDGQRIMGEEAARVLECSLECAVERFPHQGSNKVFQLEPRLVERIRNERSPGVPQVPSARKSLVDRHHGSAQFPSAPRARQQDRTPPPRRELSDELARKLEIPMHAIPAALMGQAGGNRAIHDHRPVYESDLPSGQDPHPHLPVLGPELLRIEDAHFLERTAPHHHP